jgi:hypothetical protein
VIHRGFAILPTLALISCQAEPEAASQTYSADEVRSELNGAEPAEQPRFDPAAVEAMKQQLLAEPKISDVLFQPSRLAVEWQVAVADDGTSRIGFAGYVCQLLRAKGLVDDDVDVRVVDRARIEEGTRSASLGHVRCSDESDLGV